MELIDLMPSVGKLIPYGYAKIKNTESERIINGSLRNLRAVEKPLFKQISGIPGSGKTLLSQMHRGDNYLYVSFDMIMEQLGGYRQDLEVLGAAKAFENWEIFARVAGYELLRRAVAKRLNIVLEHSGVNAAHVELFKKLKELGYTTEINFTRCDAELAHTRVAEREKIAKRHTPRHLIEERAAALEEYMAVYQGIADKVRIFDTCGEAPVEI